MPATGPDTPAEFETDHCEWRDGDERCERPVTAIIRVFGGYLHVCDKHLHDAANQPVEIEIVLLESHTDPDETTDQ